MDLLFIIIGFALPFLIWGAASLNRPRYNRNVHRNRQTLPPVIVISNLKFKVANQIQPEKIRRN